MEKVNAMDRISRLPEEVMQYILSFLSIKDVIRTTVLSKTWNKAWAVNATLQLNEKVFPSVEPWKIDDEEIMSKRHEIDFVEYTLHGRNRHKISIATLSINKIIYNPKEAAVVDKWIGYAVQTNVRTLDLLIIDSRYMFYSLPHTVFSVKSLTKLALYWCKLELPCSHMKLPCLEELTLLRVHLDDQIFCNIIASCPAIKNLRLFKCSGFTSLKISGARKLKFLTLFVYPPHELESVEIEALHLEIFVFEGWYAPTTIDVTACKNLKTLLLFGGTMTDKMFHGLFSQLPLLQKLDLVDCNTLGRINISSNSLKILEIIDCKKLVEVKIDIPYLLAFMYRGKNMISFTSHALALVKAGLELYTRSIDYLWYARATEFLGKFNKSEHVYLRGYSYKSMIIPKELRGTLLPPLYNVKHLTLNLAEPFPIVEAVELVDGLLWICPCPETLSIKSGPIKISLKFKYAYEKAMEREQKPCCCTSLPFMCWRHCLKEVEIVNFPEFESKMNVKEYFLENAKIIKKIDDLITIVTDDM